MEKEGEIGHAHPDRFVPPRESNRISVNRMGFAPDAKMAEIGLRNAAADKGKDFWGWYILSDQDIQNASRNESTTKSNEEPHFIPVLLDLENRHIELRKYANKLSEHTEFLPWRDWVSELE